MLDPIKKMVEFYDKMEKEIGFIRSIIEKQTETYNYKDLVTNDEFAKDMKVSVRTVQRWRDEGLLTYIRIGKSIYYRKEDIESALEAGTIKGFYEEDKLL